MSIEVILLIVLLVICILAVVLFFVLKNNKKLNNALSDEDRKLLSQEIEKGLVLEDEFVVTYFNVIRNKGYMHSFGGYEKQAEDLLYKMIEESKAHKATLSKIKRELSL